MEAQNTGNKQFRLEAMTPHSRGDWLPVFFFEEDKLHVIEAFVRAAEESGDEWQFRVLTDVTGG